MGKSYNRRFRKNGLSFMENDASWHGSAPNTQQYEQAMAELRKGDAQS